MTLEPNENIDRNVPIKQVTIIPKKKAISLIPRIGNSNSLFYYLSDDYAHFTDLRHQLSGKVEIRNLSGIFHDTFKEIKPLLLKLFADLNRKYDSPEWWGNQLASKSTSASPLILNITYLFCAKRILSRSDRHIVFVLEGRALSDCISQVSRRAGYRVRRYSSKADKCLDGVRRELRNGAKVLLFFWQSWKDRRAASKYLKPLPAKKGVAKKRIVIRSWVTDGSYDESGKFADRNFGQLPVWLTRKNYEIWTYPMFFGLFMKTKEICARLKDQDQSFLIPHHYIKPWDYLEVLYNSMRMLKIRMTYVELGDTDITPLLNEELKMRGLSPASLALNLCCPMLKRLKEGGYEIDAFYYAFESNAPEKPFVLCCRRYFPNSEIVGFQHTAFYPDQLVCCLHRDEKDCHPLPDKIVCSGPIYVKLYQSVGLPSRILVPGPNLRFKSVYCNNTEKADRTVAGRKTLLLPLTFSFELAFELLAKVNDALQHTRDYQVLVKSHPLLSKKILTQFLKKIGLSDFEYADEGIFQDGLHKTFAVVSTGGSITILEAVTMGVPVIRVVPDSTFFYDPFAASDYPLGPINTSSEIRQQLRLIDEIQNNDKEIFQKIAKNVLIDYFTKPTEENMKVFL